MMQLVGGRVLVLRPAQGPDKADLVVDAAKVEELMGVPPEKVADVMALMGDSIDNIPGAKGIGEKGARELIRRFGSVEAALDHAAEVEGKRYREALLNSREQVLLSKQLATIAADAPVELDLEALARREPDCAALRDLYAELGFTSLLRDLPAATTVSTVATDYAALDSPAAVARIPARAAARPARSPSGSRSMPASAKPKASARAWPDSRFRPQPGVARSAWCDAKGRNARRARANFSPIPQRPKIVHDPEAHRACSPALCAASATPPCSIPICCAPPPRSTTSPMWSCAI